MTTAVGKVGRRLVIAAAVLSMALSSGAAAAAAEKQLLRMQIDAGYVSEPARLRVTVGDEVRLEVEAGRPVVVHVHGLQVEITAGPGRPGVAEFVARATGRFPVHVHDTADAKAARRHSHRAPFAFLEVHPR